MTATLRVRVKNDTKQDIAGIVDDLDTAADHAGKLGDSLSDSAREASTEISRLRKEQSEEIKIIHEQRASWSALAATVIPAVGSMTAAGLSYAATLAKLAAGQKALETVMAPVLTSQRTLNTLIGLWEKAAIRGAASWAGYGAAASSALTITAAGTVTFKAYEAVLSRTGIETKQLAAATDDQKRAFAELRAEADATGISLEAAAKKAGISLESLGGTTVNNMDRLRKATTDTTDEIGRLVVSEGKLWGQATVEITGFRQQLDLVKTVWREVDAAATRSTSQAIENLGHLKTAARQAYDALNGPGASQRGDDTQHLEAARKREIDDFGRLRGVERELGQSRTDAAESRRMESLKTLSDIDGEIARQKQLAGIAASNNRFDVEAANKLRATLEALGNKRSQVESEWMKEAKSSASLTNKLQQDSEKRQQSEITGIDALIRKAKEHAAARKNSGVTDADVAKAEADAEKLSKKGGDPAAIKAAQDRAAMLAKSTNNAKDIEIELSDTMRDLEAQRTEIIGEETDKRKQLADQYRRFQKQEADASEAESNRLFNERQARIIKENDKIQKAAEQAQQDRFKLIDQQVAYDMQADAQRLAEAAKTEKEITRLREDEAKKRKAQVDRIADLVSSPQAGGQGQGSIIDQMRTKTRPRDIANQVAKNRADAALRDFDKDANTRRTEMQDKGMTGAEADARLRRQRDQLRKQAMAKGFADVRSGKADSNEVRGAENQLVQSNIQAAQKTGQLSDAVTQGMSQAAQAAIEADAKADQALAAIRQIQQALNATGQRQRSINGSLK